MFERADRGPLFKKFELQDDEIQQTKKPCQKFKSRKSHTPSSTTFGSGSVEDEKQANIYLKLRKEGCPQRTALFFASKRTCRIDATQDVDGPGTHRALRRQPVPVFKQLKGWFYDNPDYILGRNEYTSIKQILPEEGQQEQQNNYFEKQQSQIKQDYKKQIEILRNYFKDLDEQFNFTKIGDKHLRLEKIKEIVQQNKQKNANKLYFEKQDMRFYELAEMLNKQRDTTQKKNTLIQKLNVFNDVLLKNDVKNVKIKSLNVHQSQKQIKLNEEDENNNNYGQENNFESQVEIDPSYFYYFDQNQGNNNNNSIDQDNAQQQQQQTQKQQPDDLRQGMLSNTSIKVPKVRVRSEYVKSMKSAEAQTKLMEQLIQAEDMMPNSPLLIVKNNGNNNNGSNFNPSNLRISMDINTQKNIESIFNQTKYVFEKQNQAATDMKENGQKLGSQQEQRRRSSLLSKPQLSQSPVNKNSGIADQLSHQTLQQEHLQVFNQVVESLKRENFQVRTNNNANDSSPTSMRKIPMQRERSQQSVLNSNNSKNMRIMGNSHRNSIENLPDFQRLDQLCSEREKMWQTYMKRSQSTAQLLMESKQNYHTQQVQMHSTNYSNRNNNCQNKIQNRRIKSIHETQNYSNYNNNNNSSNQNKSIGNNINNYNYSNSQNNSQQVTNDHSKTFRVNRSGKPSILSMEVSLPSISSTTAVSSLAPQQQISGILKNSKNKIRHIQTLDTQFGQQQQQSNSIKSQNSFNNNLNSGAINLQTDEKQQEKGPRVTYMAQTQSHQKYNCGNRQQNISPSTSTLCFGDYKNFRESHKKQQRKSIVLQRMQSFSQKKLNFKLINDETN